MPVDAHDLKTDGSIAGVLHINPADDPIAHQAATFIVYFNDTTGRFSIDHCICLLQLSQNNHLIYQSPLSPIAPGLSQNDYTFREDGSYTLVISGRPKQDSDFQTFMLQYPVSVETGVYAADSQSNNSTLRMSIITILILLQGFGLWWMYKRLYA